VSTSHNVKPMVVMVDDNPNYLASAKMLVENMGYGVLIASDPDEAISITHDLLGPSIFLIDYSMPKKDGLTLMKEITDSARFEHVCLLVTAEENHTILAQVRKCGGWDYFSKVPPKGGAPFNLGILYESKLETAEYLLKRFDKSKKDKLTGLYTRQGVEEIWLHEFERLKRGTSSYLSCLFADVNDLKPVNDTYSPLVGDLLLSTVFSKFQEIMRGTDFAIRFGGDEGVGFFPDVNLGEVKEIAERWKDALCQVRIPIEPGRWLENISMSMGCTVLTSEEICEHPELSAEEWQTVLFKRAAKEMHVEKAKYREQKKPTIISR
jgi:diguanylate cyclase (GGDEF)-like protein